MTTKKPKENSEKLDKVQKFYIANHKSRDLKTLAHDVGASVPITRAYIKFLDKLEAGKAAELEKQRVEVEEKAKEAQPITTTARVDNLMGKGPRKGSVVMTEAASQMGDEFRKTSKMSARLAKNVQKIRPD